MGPRLVFVADVDSGHRHVGDEAMLEANLEALQLRLPGMRATVISARPWRGRAGDDNVTGPGFPPADEATERERLLLLRRFLRAAEAVDGAGRLPAADPTADLVRALRQADALVVSGGGNLNSRWPEHLVERVALARLAQRLGKPLAFLGQTLGPELTVVERDLLGGVLRQARWVGVRDLPSAALALALGVTPERLDHQLDDAFLLPPRPPDPEESRQLPVFDGQPSIAVTLHPFAPAGDDAVRSIAAQLTAVARATGARLLFVPHEEARESSDGRFERAIAAMLPPEVESSILPILPARLTRWVTGQGSLVISSRFHPLVFGLSAAVPSLGIFADEYCRVKNRGAMTHAAQEERWSLSLHEATSGVLAPRAIELWAQRERVSHELTLLEAGWRERDARRWPRLLAALGLPGAGAEPAPPEDDGQLLGHEPRALALALASALAGRDDAARAEIARLRAEVERLRSEQRWVTGTVAWRLRCSLLRLRPLRLFYRALRNLPPRGDIART
jgi:polysaccharide pyruvyl transferase WcaK-like protein